MDARAFTTGTNPGRTSDERAKQYWHTTGVLMGIKGRYARLKYDASEESMLAFINNSQRQTS